MVLDDLNSCYVSIKIRSAFPISYSLDGSASSEFLFLLLMLILVKRNLLNKMKKN